MRTPRWDAPVRLAIVSHRLPHAEIAVKRSSSIAARIDAVFWKARTASMKGAGDTSATWWGSGWVIGTAAKVAVDIGFSPFGIAIDDERSIIEPTARD